MEQSVNKVILLGNVGRTPQVKYSGFAVARFSLCTNERFKDRVGDWQERAEWHNCAATGALAEIVRDQVNHGSRLYVEGKLATRKHVTRKGEKQITEIVLSELVILSDGRGDKQRAPS